MKIYQVDAFTDKLFSGNPAAVCPLGDDWLDDSIMQSIALENNLAETAFYISWKNAYHIRWFTPTTEVELCGHATLATAFVMFACEGYKKDEIEFNSKSGVLGVRKDGEYITLDFPADTITKTNTTDEIRACFDIEPLEVFKGKSDLMLVFENESQVKNIGFDLAKIRSLDARGVIVTAMGTKSDFVSRFFAPQCGIDEDPVTGSAHTTLVPYWSKVLRKDELSAIQLSARKGYLLCRNKTDRIEISGKAKLYMKGEIELQ
jgi:PhzF family phenazine biosynthesis protein